MSILLILKQINIINKNKIKIQIALKNPMIFNNTWFSNIY